MKQARVVLAFALTTLAIIAGEWAFRGYLKPASVIDFANRLFYCA